MSDETVLTNARIVTEAGLLPPDFVPPQEAPEEAGAAAG